MRNNVIRDHHDQQAKSLGRSDLLPRATPPAPNKADSAFDHTKKISSNACNSSSKSAAARIRTPTTPDVIHKVKQERKDDDITMLSVQRNEYHAPSGSFSADSADPANHRIHNHGLPKDNFLARPPSNLPSTSSSNSIPSSLNLVNMLDRARMLGPLGLRVPPPHGALPPDRPHSLALWDLYRSSLDYNPMQFPRDMSDHERELLHRFGSPMASAANPMMLPHHAAAATAFPPPRYRQDMDSAAAIMRELERNKALRMNDASGYLNSAATLFPPALPPPPRNSASSPMINSHGMGAKSNSPLVNSMGIGPPPLIPSGGHNHQRPSPINSMIYKYTNSLENPVVKDSKKDASLANHELDHQSR